MDITFIDETETISSDQTKELNQLLEFAATVVKIPEDTEMSVVFMDNQRIQQINKEYRDKDAPTDVISFALEEEGDEEPSISFDQMSTEIPRNLGDIMISVERTKEQATEYGHSFERELGFLALHGFLHLNGYDHMTPDDEKEMFGLQKEILDAYGLKR